MTASQRIEMVTKMLEAGIITEKEIIDFINETNEDSPFQLNEKLE